MSIYTPYFYIIQDIHNGIYYAGAKWGVGANPATFMTEGGYTTSSNKIKKLIRENGLSLFKIVKIRTFHTAIESQNYETRFLKKIDARNNIKFYNGHNNDWELHDNKNKVTVIDKSGDTFQTDITDPDYLSKELKGATFGTKSGVEIKTGIKSNFSLNDARWLTGEIKSVNKGKSHYKDAVGNSFFVDKKNAEKLNLSSFSKGRITVKDNDGNTFSVKADDSRYISGELVGATSGMTTVKDSSGNTFSIPANDQRIKTGELIPVNSKMAVVKDKFGNKFRISKDDSRYISGELVGATSGMKFYNNGEINKRFNNSDIIPAEFKLGRIKKT